MFRIGLAGGMGSGKSEVAARLSELGALVIEVDAVARDIVAVGTEVFTAIVGAFGESVLADDGGLDREALSAAAFSSEGATNVLNAITHPALIREIIRRSEGLERQSPSGILVVDAALLVQWDVLDMFDVVLVVHAPRELRVRRLVEAGFAEEDVRRRMQSQLPDDVMVAAADVVIENGGSIDELRAAVDDFWESLPGNQREDEK
jgi:dephospho-CoA kinase